MNELITFRVPADWLKSIDEAAAADHRNRTSMLHKIIAFYFEHNHQPNGKNPLAPRKKVGTC